MVTVSERREEEERGEDERREEKRRRGGDVPLLFYSPSSRGERAKQGGSRVRQRNE